MNLLTLISNSISSITPIHSSKSSLKKKEVTVKDQAMKNKLLIETDLIVKKGTTHLWILEWPLIESLHN